MNPLISRFRPTEKGLSQILGELEADIMEIIWAKEESVSVRDVLSELRKTREIAYTTVMTVMSRLNKKGLIVCNKFHKGQAFIYSSVFSKEEFTKNTVKSVLKGLLSSFSDIAVTQFVNELANDQKSLKQLQKLIKERLGNEKQA